MAQFRVFCKSGTELASFDLSDTNGNNPTNRYLLLKRIENDDLIRGEEGRYVILQPMFFREGCHLKSHGFW
jgi:hypothetical protein